MMKMMMAGMIMMRMLKALGSLRGELSMGSRCCREIQCPPICTEEEEEEEEQEEEQDRRRSWRHRWHCCLPPWVVGREVFCYCSGQEGKDGAA